MVGGARGDQGKNKGGGTGGGGGGGRFFLLRWRQSPRVQTKRRAKQGGGAYLSARGLGWVWWRAEGGGGGGWGGGAWVWFGPPITGAILSTQGVLEGGGVGGGGGGGRGGACLGGGGRGRRFFLGFRLGEPQKPQGGRDGGAQGMENKFYSPQKKKQQRGGGGGGGGGARSHTGGRFF